MVFQAFFAVISRKTRACCIRRYDSSSLCKTVLLIKRGGPFLWIFITAEKLVIIWKKALYLTVVMTISPPCFRMADIFRNDCWTTKISMAKVT